MAASHRTRPRSSPRSARRTRWLVGFGLSLGSALGVGSITALADDSATNGKGRTRAVEQQPAFQEVVEDLSRYGAPPGAERAREAILLERVTTGVPWPRGLEWAGEELIVLARGRHRTAGGIDPAIDDRAGSLFAVDPRIAEPVIGDRPAGEAVRRNARLLVAPVVPPFHLYEPTRGAPIDDALMDRPYCTLAWDETSANFFLCGYSGVDLPEARFRKNATDSILRFDTRVGQWFVVESHDPSTVAAAMQTRVVPNTSYPHHDVSVHAPPHGWINGPDGCQVVGRFLYAAGKDNHVLVQYDLDEIRRDPHAPSPPSRVVLGDRAAVRLPDGTRTLAILGHSAVAAHDGWIYLGFRTSSIVLRFAIDETGDLLRPVEGELIAVFEPWDATTKRSADLMDLAFDSAGRLYVACAKQGRVWRVGVPDPSRVFYGDDRSDRPTTDDPFLDLRALTSNPKAKCGNILFDSRDRLYVCSGNYDAGTEIAGVVYRATTRPASPAPDAVPEGSAPAGRGASR